MIAAGQHVALGLSWHDGAAFVRMRQVGAEVSALLPLRGLGLRYRVVPDGVRACLGHQSASEGRYVDCLKPLEDPQLAKCTRCRVVDARFAASLHHAHRTDVAEVAAGDIERSVAQHLEQTNWIYLAAFRDGSLKVGTSSERRRYTRLQEQGAWKARFVAQARDGIAVRVAEDLITARLDISQSVSARRKRRGLATSVPDTQLDTRLAQSAEAVHHLLADATDDGTVQGVAVADEPWESAAVGQPVWDRLMDYPVHLGSGAHAVQVVEVCGRMLAVEQPRSGDRFVTDVAELFGFPIDVGDHEPDPIQVQDSLF